MYRRLSFVLSNSLKIYKALKMNKYINTCTCQDCSLLCSRTSNFTCFDAGVADNSVSIVTGASFNAGECVKVLILASF